MSDAVAAYTAQLNNAEQLIADGNSQDIVDMAASDTPAGQLKNAILDVSPYASDRLLLAALNDKPTPMPPGHIKEIIVANSPVTDNVMQAVNSKNLPQGIQNQVNAAQAGVSEREKLEGQITWVRAQLQQINNFSVNYYLENGDTASAINLLNTSDNYYDKKTLAELYLSQGDYNTALLVAQDATNFAQGTQLDDAGNYIQLLNIYIDLAVSDKTIFDIDLSQEQIIRNMASVETETGTDALIILEALYGEEFEYPILKFGSQARSMTFNNNISAIDYQNFNSGMFNIYPNPNNGKMYLDYDLESDGKLLIFDKTGRKIVEYSLDKGKNKLSISNLNIDSGIYTYRISTKNEYLKEGKLVIIK